MINKATFVFNFDSSREARLISESLYPEVKHRIPKTNVDVSLSKNMLSLSIESKDISALRAACNSYLRWIYTALTVKQLV